MRYFYLLTASFLVGCTRIDHGHPDFSNMRLDKMEIYRKSIFHYAYYDDLYRDGKIDHGENWVFFPGDGASPSVLLFVNEKRPRVFLKEFDGFSNKYSESKLVFRDNAWRPENKKQITHQLWGDQLIKLGVDEGKL